MKRAIIVVSVLFTLLCENAEGQVRCLKKASYIFLNNFFSQIDSNAKISLEVLHTRGAVYDIEKMLDINFLKESKSYRLSSSSEIDLDKVLTVDDLLYMKKQVKKSESIKYLDKSKLKNWADKLILKPTMDDWIALNFSSLYNVSFPLFNLKKNIVAIYFEEKCGIVDCGSGQLNIYQLQENGDLKLIGSIFTWIS